METMLILTDFSESALRAAEYGAELAGPLKVKRILLYHAYQSVFPGTDLPESTTVSAKQLYLNSMQNLSRLHDLLTTFITPAQPITIETLAEDASLSARINHLCKKEHVDIIVMGVSGRSGLEKLLLGNTTSMMIGESKVPVLIVPKDIIIGKGVKNIVFATDLKDNSVIPMHGLYEFLDAFPGKVRVVNVAPGTPETYSADARENIAELRNIFERYDPAFDYINERNVVSGILSYAKDHDASLIMVVPLKHGFFADVFREGIAKKLAYNSSVPLLSLPPTH
ncbi:universal stress protein [Chitinophaga sp. 30R24]|uniref:universal stress protein n=1 Tax=Chitinophaga sp. 30R24 TaxID=3248838 RepID=UPI003B8EE022